MTKRELAAALAAEERLGLSGKKAVDVIETIFDLIVCNFQNGDMRLDIRGFGSLKIKERHAFVGRDPRNGAPRNVAAKKSISFKPGAEVLRRINSY